MVPPTLDWRGYLAALGIGVLLAGVRLVVVNDFLFKRPYSWLRVADAPDYEEARRHEPGCEAAYRDIRSSYYPYFQFYSQMFVALPPVFLVWAWKGAPTLLTLAVAVAALVAIEAVLYRNAKYSMERFNERRAKLLHMPARLAS